MEMVIVTEFFLTLKKHVTDRLTLLIKKMRALCKMNRRKAVKQK